MADEIVTELTDEVRKITRKPNRQIRPDEPLLSTGVIDSFHLVDLAAFVEDHFGVRLDDTELNAETFDTLDQLAAIIRERQ
jgi:acyl carrier protein